MKKNIYKHPETEISFIKSMTIMTYSITYGGEAKEDITGD